MSSIDAVIAELSTLLKEVILCGADNVGLESSTRFARNDVRTNFGLSLVAMMVGFLHCSFSSFLGCFHLVSDSIRSAMNEDNCNVGTAFIY